MLAQISVATHSNDYCKIHFNLCQHSKIAQEQKLSKFCLYSFIRLILVPAVVYISAVGRVTLTRRASSVYCIGTDFYQNIIVFMALGRAIVRDMALGRASVRDMALGRAIVRDMALGRASFKITRAMFKGKEDIFYLVRLIY